MITSFLIDLFIVLLPIFEYRQRFVELELMRSGFQLLREKWYLFLTNLDDMSLVMEVESSILLCVEL